jgi:PAS domain S-box-containing protein
VASKLITFWMDLPLRAKGIVVVSIPLAALLAAAASFYVIQRVDHETDPMVQRTTEVLDRLRDCSARFVDAESAASACMLAPRPQQVARLTAAQRALRADLARLEYLLRGDPNELRRLRRVQQLYEDAAAVWVPLCKSATLPRSDSLVRSQATAQAMPAELRAMGDDSRRLLVARAARETRIRSQALLFGLFDTLFGLGTGTFALLLFTSGIVRGVKRLQYNANSLEQGLPMLPWLGHRDDLGALADSLARTATSLRQSEHERERFFTLSIDMLCIASLDGRFIRVNPACTRTLGHSQDELIGKSMLDFIYPEDRETTARQLTELTRGNPIAYFENRFRCADGSYKWLAWSSAPFLAEGRVYAVARDRSKRKLAQEALLESNARLVSVLENTTDAFFAVDRHWCLIRINQQAERLWDCRRQDLLGRNLWEVFPETLGGPFFQMYDEAMRSGTPAHREEFSPPLRRWLEVHAYPSPEGLSVYFRDITERRRASEELKRALQEKEVLLREIHHRVKNNLQVICSLLRLQAGSLQDETVSQVLRECRERVLAMAMLHDQLHRGKDLSNIDLGEYLRNLAASLFCSYGVNSTQIDLGMEVEDITVAIDTAIPCGLIVQELLSNSLRHAFPNGNKGRIWVALRATSGQIELTVSDDGTGFPQTAPPAISRSLGLRLVDLLSEQIEASVERYCAAGTHYRLRFQQKILKESK